MKKRLLSCIKSGTQSALKTIWWLAKIMVGVSFLIMMLQYIGVIQWISYWLTPIFSHIGLPGEAAIAYVTGYFVNCYSAMAVISTLSLNWRAVTIISVMVLCSHSMVVETAVQHKTGSSAVRIVAIRTLSAFILAYLLNLIMPDKVNFENIAQVASEKIAFITLLKGWAFRTAKNVFLMMALVYLLTVFQRILSEFGIIEYIASLLSPLMKFFGLSPRTAFLWLVANTLGLAYGAAVMIDETEQGHTTREENDLLNHHICVSHSNLEDLLLFTAIGGSFLWMLLSRWAMSLLLVWERRLEKKVK